MIGNGAHLGKSLGENKVHGLCIRSQCFHFLLQWEDLSKRLHIVPYVSEHEIHQHPSLPCLVVQPAYGGRQSNLQRLLLKCVIIPEAIEVVPLALLREPRWRDRHLRQCFRRFDPSSSFPLHLRALLLVNEVCRIAPGPTITVAGAVFFGLPIQTHLAGGGGFLEDVCPDLPLQELPGELHVDAVGTEEHAPLALDDRVHLKEPQYDAAISHQQLSLAPHAFRATRGERTMGG